MKHIILSILIVIPVLGMSTSAQSACQRYDNLRFKQIHPPNGYDRSREHSILSGVVSGVYYSKDDTQVRFDVINARNPYNRSGGVDLKCAYISLKATTSLNAKQKAALDSVEIAGRRLTFYPILDILSSYATLLSFNEKVMIHGVD